MRALMFRLGAHASAGVSPWVVLSLGKTLIARDSTNGRLQVERGCDVVTIPFLIFL
jgi:hypothetical protein